MAATTKTSRPAKHSQKVLRNGLEVGVLLGHPGLRVLLSLEQALVLEHQTLLVRLSISPGGPRRVGVLHGRALLLLVSLHLTVLRRQEKGFLGDVHPSQHDDSADDVLVDRALHQDRDVGADCARLRRPPAGAGQALQIYQIQEAV